MRSATISSTLAAALAAATAFSSIAASSAFAPSAAFCSVSGVSNSLSHHASSATSSTLFAADESSTNGLADADLSDVGFVLLAGGTGSRMKANMPKQYLTLRGMPVLHHSLDLFLERLPVFAQENGKR